MEKCYKILSAIVQSFKYIVLAMLFNIGNTSIIYAQQATLLAQFAYKVNFMVGNSNSGLIYASTDNGILIINPKNKTTSIIPELGNLSGLTLSDDKTKLYAARASTQEIMVIDVVSNSPIEYITLPYMPYDLKFAADGNLYATLQNSGQSGFMQIDPQNKKFLTMYENDVFDNTFIDDRSLIEVSPDRKYLYLANMGYSPARLTVFKVSESSQSNELNFVYTNTHGSLGGNGQDLHVTSNGDYIYYVVGSGNRSYDIARIQTKDMTINGRLQTGPYPRAITTSPDGIIAYINNGAPKIQVWNTETQTKLCEFNVDTDGQTINKLALDKSGEILLVVLTNSMKLYKSACPN